MALTNLERVILELVSKGKGKWGWYQICTRLSRMEVDRDPDPMTVLKELSSRGLVLRHVKPESPDDRWAITNAGAEVLKSGHNNEA